MSVEPGGGRGTVDELAGVAGGVEEVVQSTGNAGVGRGVVQLTGLDGAGLANETVVDQKYLPVARIALALTDVQHVPRLAGIAVLSA